MTMTQMIYVNGRRLEFVRKSEFDSTVEWAIQKYGKENVEVVNKAK